MNGVAPSESLTSSGEPFWRGTALNGFMGKAIRRKTAASMLSLVLACGWAACAGAADFTLTPAEIQKLNQREVVIRAKVDQGSQRKGTVRAAIQIEASPDIVFGMMTNCADALRYVPHLEECRVRDAAPDGSWQLIEHEIDFGWYTPRLRWVFRVDFEGKSAMRFRQVSGDFKANEGMWELEPDDTGTRTLLRYRAYIDPPGFVPNWLARSTFKRELPQMLQDLRRLCEAQQAASTPAVVSPR
jgi:hypothetical protein